MKVPILGAGAVDLSKVGQEEPQGLEIDLTSSEPLSDDQFRKGLLMVLNNIAGELGVLSEITAGETKMRHDMAGMNLRSMMAFEAIAEAVLGMVVVGENESAPLTEEAQAAAAAADQPAPPEILWQKPEPQRPMTEPERVD